MQNSEIKFQKIGFVPKGAYLYFILATTAVTVLSALFLRFIFLTERAGASVPGIPGLVFIIVLVWLSVMALGLAFFLVVLRPLKRSGRILNSSLSDLYSLLPDEDLDGISYDKALRVIFQYQTQSVHKTLQLEYLKKEAELNFFQSQINPHFLYNTLESIRGLALMQDAYDVAEMLEHLAALFRNMTRKADALITVREELQNVENYILIQQMRFRDKFTYHVDQSEDSDELLEFNIPNLILQPLIENAISHGFSSIVTGGKITLSAARTQSRLIIKIEDNGAGISQEELKNINRVLAGHIRQALPDKRHTGVALGNINQRIQHQFGSRYGICISSTQNVGTTVTVCLPLVS